MKKTPSQDKALSNQIKGVNEAIWQNKAPAIMKKGLELKLNSGSQFKSALADTKGESWGRPYLLITFGAQNHGSWRS